MAANTRLSEPEKLALANGWSALQVLMMEEVTKFRERLCAVDPRDTKGVLVAHQCYTAAATFHNDLLKMVAAEISEYAPTPLNLPDITEGLMQ